VPLDPVTETETETEDVPATVAPLTAVASADFVITGGPTVPPLVPLIAVAVSSTTGSSTLSYVHRTAVVSPVSIDTTVNGPFAGAGPSAIARDVLVIEDDGAIRSVLDRGLRAEGFDVEVCADGPSGLRKELEGGHAAIVLDLLLPGMSGYKVCEMVRAEGVTTPILVLTAKSGKYDQIDLLDAGADDFLIKSASIALISARLRALIRRAETMSSNVVGRGSLQYDLATRARTVDSAEVTLTNREDQLRRHLLLANGGGVTRQELLDDVWGTDS
jgi:two-component system OmpR family response regulator